MKNGSALDIAAQRDPKDSEPAPVRIGEGPVRFLTVSFE